MCRYAMFKYKPHYTCFECQKTFKRKLLGDVYNSISKDFKENPAKCPECGSLMANMGKDFEAPKKKDDKAWAHIKQLYKVGIAFHSCGCSGPGYVPKDNVQLLKQLNSYLKNYHKSLRDYRDWVIPEDLVEFQKDTQRNSHYYCCIKGKRNPEKARQKKEDAIAHFLEKIKEMEEKIKSIQNE